ncbi:diaminobutyrate acetyltransferase [Aliidiomarina shirensis]|uniref:L-2,4-diaminobutyric acid acetyltransferase n=1 Tax=Aliidiomarina shirensis TaxID=1048642 RepID=A0A432WKM9_9GAMM|nr:diaminobutyrate acetyltransferase [Aliidiomarina shirensis]RUO34353.1 diaminobutyrate acetyltransferase [Aliidiomarina shirensis]
MKIELKIPESEDGLAVNQLVAQNPPLDTNSLYCNLLQTTHFAETAVAAWHDGELVGFVSGYIKPEQPDTYFLWQVVVGEAARGQGLAKRMIQSIFQRSNLAAVRWLETTITPDNEASQRLFKSLARDWSAQIDVNVLFDKQEHFGGQHNSEELYRIGPINK